MGTAASPFLNPIAAELESVSSKRTARALSLRARQRRQIQGMIAASYLVDALGLLIYAQAGTIPSTTSSAFAVLGLPSAAWAIALSETWINHRFQDPYLL